MRTNWVAVAVMLALLLVVLASSTQRPPSAGFMINIAVAPENCGDGRSIVASAVGNHHVTLKL